MSGFVTGQSREQARALLVEHLRKMRRDGDTEIWLGEESRSFLRDLYLGKGPPRVGEPGPASTAASGGRGKPPRTVDADHPGRPEKAGLLDHLEQAGATDSPPRRRVVKKALRKDPDKVLPKLDEMPVCPVPKTGTKQERIEEIRETLAACPIAAAQKNLRDKLVFSVGNPDAELMFVGEAPGYEEEKHAEPFVGPAGQLLTKIVETMGLRRDQVYISNIVKYRPKIAGTSDQGMRNRKPTPEEMAVFLPFLFSEIAVVEPRVIVALGATAIEGLLDRPTSVGRARDQWHEFRHIKLRATYHPSYLLRNESLTERRKLWLDMLAVMEELHLPISAKQREFFKQ